jgi:S-(hydroxymethyl)glutathione dehydrogenase/alcohol dehydrogenase
VQHAVRPGGTALLLGMASDAPLVVDTVAAVILQERVVTGSMLGSGYGYAIARL